MRPVKRDLSNISKSLSSSIYLLFFAQHQIQVDLNETNKRIGMQHRNNIELEKEISSTRESVKHNEQMMSKWAGEQLLLQ